jgi:hypothetical protein
MPRVPRTRQPRINAPRSDMPRSRDERDSSPVRMPSFAFLEPRAVHTDNLTDISIDSYSSEINLIVDGERDKMNVGVFNESISQWLGQEYVMRPTLNRDPQSRLDWDRWATPVAQFVDLHFADEEHNNPAGLQYPYCGVVACFITECVGGNEDALDYLACLLGRVLSSRARRSLPIIELLTDIYPYMRKQGLVEHPFFKTLNWAQRVGYEFVMWERHNFVLHTTLGPFERTPTYPLPDPSVFELLPEYSRQSKPGPLRMRAPPSAGPFTPAPEPTQAQLASLEARRDRRRKQEASVAFTRTRREIQLPSRYKA